MKLVEVSTSCLIKAGEMRCRVLCATDIIGRAKEMNPGRFGFPNPSRIAPTNPWTAARIESYRCALQETLGMRRYRGVHAAEQAQVISVLCKVGEQLGYLKSALAVMLNFHGGHQLAVAKFGQLLACP